MKDNQMASTFSLGETIQQKALQNLSPEAKIDVIRGLVKKLVREHQDGVTAPTVAEELNISKNTAKKHLDYLVATREIYNKIYSTRNIVYFPRQHA